MTPTEKSIIVGLFRQGNEFWIIGCLMGISDWYAKQIVQEYLKQVK